MAHTPPINLKELNKTGIFNEDRFFQLISEENNYIDPKSAREFYYAMVRVVTSELRKNGIVRLPELGDFALVKSKDRLGWVGKTQQIIKGVYMLKFYPKDAWRAYFKKLEGKNGLEGSLDPREKVLGRELPENGMNW